MSERDRDAVRRLTQACRAAVVLVMGAGVVPALLLYAGGNREAVAIAAFSWASYAWHMLGATRRDR